MRLVVVSVLTLCGSLLGSWPPAEALDTALTIVSPVDGAVLAQSSVPIQTRFVKGTLGDHLHIYVNGAFFKSSKRESLTLWDLKDGDHTIELRAASREKDEKGIEHKELGVNATIKVTVAAKNPKAPLTSATTTSP